MISWLSFLRCCFCLVIVSDLKMYREHIYVLRIIWFLIIFRLLFFSPLSSKEERHKPLIRLVADERRSYKHHIKRATVLPNQTNGNLEADNSRETGVLNPFNRNHERQSIIPTTPELPINEQHLTSISRNKHSIQASRIATEHHI